MENTYSKNSSVIPGIFNIYRSCIKSSIEILKYNSILQIWVQNNPYIFNFNYLFLSIFIISPNITIVVDISYSKHGNKFTADFTIIIKTKLSHLMYNGIVTNKMKNKKYRNFIMESNQSTQSIKFGLKIIHIYLTSIIKFNYSIPLSIFYNTTKQKNYFL
jgi:hypothetical protein